MLVFSSRPGILSDGRVDIFVFMIELLVLAVIPALLIIWYIYRKDRGTSRNRNTWLPRFSCSVHCRYSRPPFWRWYFPQGFLFLP